MIIQYSAARYIEVRYTMRHDILCGAKYSRRRCRCRAPLAALSISCNGEYGMGMVYNSVYQIIYNPNA